MKTRLQSLALHGYAMLTRVLAPLYLRKLKKTAGNDAALRARQRERLGHVAEAKGELWLHAASVGEVHAALRLVQQLLASDERLKIVISTQTVTGAERVRVLFSDQLRVRHQFAPLDTRASVRRWLDQTRPRALLLVETELWPALLDECARRTVPVALVNARLSATSVRRYAKLRALFVPALRTIDPILCQSERDRERFASLLEQTDSLQVTGNLKFDQTTAAELDPQVRQWQQQWHGRPIWVAGSTHQGEEPIALAAHQNVLAQYPAALLILVPRHPERAQALFEQFSAQGESIAWPDQSQPDSQIVLIDQMGVLAGLYAIADACLVGGSLVEGIGGHNLLEPAWAGREVIAGPYVGDQQAIAQVLNSAGTLTEVRDAGSLADEVIKALSDTERAAERGQSAFKAARARAGALKRNLERLRPWLDATAD